MTLLDLRQEYGAGRWQETNPAFAASLDGTWLVEVGPTGPAFDRIDRLCAVIRDGLVTGGGKFFSWHGHVTPKIDADGGTWRFTGTLDIKRIAQPWYENSWTEADSDFRIPLKFELINSQMAWGEMTRDGVGAIASYWHKLLA